MRMKYGLSARFAIVLSAAAAGWSGAARGEQATPTLSLDIATTEPAEATPPFGFTGPWNGGREDLMKRGFEFGGYLAVDVSKNLRGGLDTEATPVRYLLDLHVALDGEKLVGVPGATFLVDFQSHDGPNAIENLTGELQGFDNMDARSFVQIYQLWWEQEWGGEALRTKVGKMDGATEFSVMPHSVEFLNSTMPWSVSMFTFPTYPDAAPGSLVCWKPAEWFFVQGGVFYSNASETFLDLAGHPQACRTAAGGIFLIGETGLQWKLGEEMPGKFAVGSWRHTGEFAAQDGGANIGGASGAYFSADQTLWHKEGDGLRDAGIFLEGGMAQGDVSPISQQLGGGLTLTGLVPGRAEDVMGFGAAWAKPGDQGARFGFEMAWEWFYKVQITSWASTKWDVQYVRHPGAAYGDALVTTLRVQIDF
jgi:porin